MRPANKTTAHDWIRPRGVCTHNLRDVDVDLPKRELVAITGVSGSAATFLSGLTTVIVVLAAGRTIGRLSAT